MFPVRIYYESAAYGSAISHRRSSVRARAPGLARPPRVRSQSRAIVYPDQAAAHLQSGTAPGPAATSCSYRLSAAHVAHVSVRVFAHEPHRGFEPTAARFMMNDLTGMP